MSTNIETKSFYRMWRLLLPWLTEWLQNCKVIVYE